MATKNAEPNKSWTIHRLWQEKRVKTKPRGKAIASALGLTEPFSDEEANAIHEVNTLMDANRIGDAAEATARYQAGDRPQPKQASSRQATQGVGALEHRTSEELRSDRLKLAAEQGEHTAAEIQITRDVTTAYVLSTGNYSNPELSEEVLKGQLLVESAITGFVPGKSPKELLSSSIAAFRQQGSLAAGTDS